MADVKKSLMLMGVLGIILLVLVIIFAVALIVGAEFQQQICINDGGTFSGGSCTVESAAWNSTVILLTQITTVVGFIGIVVLTAIGAILIGMAKGFMNSDM